MEDRHPTTLRQKLATMTQLTSENISSVATKENTGAQALFELTDEDRRFIGSTLNCLDKEEIDRVKADCGDGLIFMLDMIHGYRTIYPIPLALASSFDCTLARRIAAASATACRKAGVDVTFSPMCDLARDPRWGRVMEGYGEDVELACRMIASTVEGYHQGGMLSCIKHFISYSAPEGGREYNNAEISQNTLHESYLPLYRAGIQAGADMVMCAFNSWNGIPLTCHRELLVDILRGRLDFDGVLISDYAAVDELIRHTAARNGKEAAELALAAGLDIEMMSTNFLNYGEELVEEGLVSKERIDESVRRIERLKAKRHEAGVSIEDEKALGILASEESAILLKNDGVLPLCGPYRLCGSFADEKRVLGGWSLDQREGLSLKDCLEGEEGADTVIVATGEDQEWTGEGASRSSLSLPAEDIALVRTLKEAGRKVVLVVYAGRPLVLTDVEAYCDAILYAWFPGTYGNIGIARLLKGEASPQGKAPMSFPRSVGQIPVNYDHFTTGRPWDGKDPSRYFSRYVDESNSPLYPFGHGLTYGDCVVTKAQIVGDEVIVEIENRGRFDAVETVQLYVHKAVKGRAMRVARLKDFSKLRCKAGGRASVAFPITKAMLTVSVGLEEVFIPGDFTIYAGLSSQDLTAMALNIGKEQFDGLQ